MIHFFDDEQIDVVKYGTNIYSGSVLSKGKTHTNFYKGKRTFAVSVIPTLKYLEKLVEKKYNFSNIIYDEIHAQSKTITPKRYLVNAQLNHPVQSIINAIKENNILAELIEIWAKEYFLNLMQYCVKPQSTFEKVQETIQINISIKTTLESTAKELGVSKRTLNKIFSEHNLTFKEYKQSTLKTKAKEMLEQGYNKNEVYKKLKFSSLGYFNKYIV